LAFKAISAEPAFTSKEKPGLSVPIPTLPRASIDKSVIHAAESSSAVLLPTSNFA